MANDAQKLRMKKRQQAQRKLQSQENKNRNKIQRKLQMQKKKKEQQLQKKKKENNGLSKPGMCQVLTDPADQKSIGKMWESYNGNAAGLPAFILNMDQLITKFRSQYNSESAPEDETNFQQSDGIPEEDQDDFLEDDENDEEMEDEGGDDAEEEVQSLYDEASWQTTVAQSRFEDSSSFEPEFYSVKAHEIDEVSKNNIRELFGKFKVVVSGIAPDAKDNSLLILTSVTSFSTKRIADIEENLRIMYPHMEMMKVLSSKSRVAFKLQL